MWVIDTVENLCEIEYGTRVVRKREQGTIYPVYGGGGETFRIDRKNRTSRVVIARFGMSERCTRYVDGDFFLNDSGLTLSPKSDKLSQDFLNKIVFSLNDSIYSIGRGTAQKNLNMDAFKKLIISYPPVAEQKRIVAKLDAAFAEIDEAVAVTTKNIETVEFLFQKSLDKIFCNPSLKFIELDEACSIIGGGTPSKKNKSFYVGKVPWATVRDMKSDYISNTEFKITNDAIKKSSTNVIPSGNVVIATRVGLGKICIVEEDTAINQDLKGIIPKNTELLDTDFLFFWFKSISKKIINAGTGATVQGVKLPFIKSLKIPDIDITSQKKLASSAKFISKQSELLARIYNKKSNDLAVLKAAILKQELQPSEAA
jgi:type I restriction enzyme S subunit